jgi:hypothetical protein
VASGTFKAATKLEEGLIMARILALLMIKRGKINDNWMVINVN